MIPRITTNFTEFKQGLIEIELKVISKSVESVAQAMIAYMNDCINEIPKVPVDTGSLAGSHSVFVDGKLVATSASDRTGSSEYNPTPLTTFPITELLSKTVVGLLVAHKAYAASLHTGVSRHGTAYTFKSPGSGSHWILAKALVNHQKYIKIIAEGL